MSRVASNHQEAYGVPDSLRFKEEPGSLQNAVYECVVCGETIIGTETAKRHDTCHRAPECPGCGRRAGRPSLGTDYGRVDECTCGMDFRGGEE